MEQTRHYFDWWPIPPEQFTEKQLLKQRRRLIKNAAPVGKITCIFDHPRCRPKKVEVVPAAECEQIRNKLRLYGPDGTDQWAFYRLARAGQVVTMNLYDIRCSEPITSFTEKEATDLLGYMVWDYSHEAHYITEATVEGERRRRTWKRDVSNPDLNLHLRGERYFGVKKGQMTMQIAPECDRHSGAIPGQEHVTQTLKIGQVLTRRFPQYRFAPEVNPNNGSVRFFGWLPDDTSMPIAERMGEEVRAVLQRELPSYDFRRMEIYPASSPQIFAPLRADKLTVIDAGLLRKVKKHKYEVVNGEKRRTYYETYSCAAYLNWIYFSKTPYNERVFEQVLREAVARCPDGTAAKDQPTADLNTLAHKPPAGSKAKAGGMGDIGGHKGCWAALLVRFWTELDVPDDDTIGKYVVVTLRILKYEGLTSGEALAWIEDRLEALKYTDFSDRLTDNFEELQRVVSATVKAAWKNNGYQKDPVTSEAKLKAVVAAWTKKGFRLYDPATWQAHTHPPAAGPDLKLVWTPALLAIVPALAAQAHATTEQATRFIEKVMAFVEVNNELAKRIVGALLEEAGIKGRSGHKQTHVRKLLVDNGLLLKCKSYCRDKKTNRALGDFFICGQQVRFEEPPAPHPHTPVSIYLSSDVTPLADSDEEYLDFLLEARRLACDQRHLERLRWLKAHPSNAG